MADNKQQFDMMSGEPLDMFLKRLRLQQMINREAQFQQEVLGGAYNYGNYPRTNSALNPVIGEYVRGMQNRQNIKDLESQLQIEAAHEQVSRDAEARNIAEFVGGLSGLPSNAPVKTGPNAYATRGRIIEEAGGTPPQYREEVHPGAAQAVLDEHLASEEGQRKVQNMINQFQMRAAFADRERQQKGQKSWGQYTIKERQGEWDAFYASIAMNKNPGYVHSKLTAFYVRNPGAMADAPPDPHFVKYETYITAMSAAQMQLEKQGHLGEPPPEAEPPPKQKTKTETQRGTIAPQLSETRKKIQDYDLGDYSVK